MLPSPSVARYQRRRLDSSPRKKILETLTQRSRLTNLGVFLIIGLCTLSLLFNLHYWTSYTPLSENQLRNRHSLLQVDRPEARTHLDHLIIVPCHGIWKGTTSWLEEKDWVLESYQTGNNRLNAFYEHIAHGYVVGVLCSCPLLFMLYPTQGSTCKGGPPFSPYFFGVCTLFVCMATHLTHPKGPDKISVFDHRSRVLHAFSTNHEFIDHHPQTFRNSCSAAGNHRKLCYGFLPKSSFLHFSLSWIRRSLSNEDICRRLRLQTREVHGSS